MKKILPITIIVAMVLAPCASFANTGITKEETVYVITKSDGKADDIIVSDHLFNDAKLKTINDKSDIKDIENVKGDEKFSQSGDSLSWKANGKDIYYQGKSSKELPVTMNLGYYLDGEKMSGKNIQGKKGNFKIEIDYENSSGVPFVILSGILMQNENYSNISVNNGKVIDDGEKTIVAGMAMPGILDKWNNIVISGHTTSFDITDIMTLATNSVFDDIELGELGNLNFDKKIKELDSGSKKLVAGSRELYKGLHKLNTSAPQLAEGINQLNLGAAGLQAGTIQMKLGVAKLSTGANKLHDGICTMQTSVNSLGIENQISGLTSGLNQLSTGVAQMTGASNAALSSADAAITAATNALASADPTVYAAVQPYLNGARQYIAGAININSSGVTEQLPTGGIKETVSGAVQQVNSGVSGLSLTALTDGLINLESGSKALSDGLQQLSGNLGVETDQSTLVGGATALANGMEQLNSNTGTLISGIQALTDGSSEMADGMEKLYREGIKKIVDLYNGDLKDIVGKVDDLLNSGKEYQTFTKLGDDMTGTVKFIIKTEIE